VDRSPPALACVPSRAVDSQAPWNFEEPVAFDLVDGANVTLAIVSTTTNVICGNKFSATRTWSATDSCGNSNRGCHRPWTQRPWGDGASADRAIRI
jgi:hypothetical protein